MSSAGMATQATKRGYEKDRRLSENKFLELAGRLPDWTLEYSAEGSLTFMPPTDPITSERNALIVHRLTDWALKDGRGRVSGPDGGYFLRDGSRLCPDAAWFEKFKWQAAKAAQPSLQFPVFTPEFIIELQSPTDRSTALHEKMEKWISNGAALAWLINPSDQSVTVYRNGHPPQRLTNITSISAEGPVDGFTLSFEGIL